MRKRIWDGCNSRGCLHFTEALVVDKKEGAVVRQRPADTRTKLVADEGWDGTATQCEIDEGALVGVGTPPGTRFGFLNRSRPSRGGAVKLRSEIIPSGGGVVSRLETPASTVTWTDSSPTTSDKLIPIAAPGLRAIPSRTSV